MIDPELVHFFCEKSTTGIINNKKRAIKNARAELYKIIKMISSLYFLIFKESVTHFVLMPGWISPWREMETLWYRNRVYEFCQAGNADFDLFSLCVSFFFLCCFSFRSPTLTEVIVKIIGTINSRWKMHCVTEKKEKLKGKEGKLIIHHPHRIIAFFSMWGELCESPGQVNEWSTQQRMGFGEIAPQYFCSRQRKLFTSKEHTSSSPLSIHS